MRISDSQSEEELARITYTPKKGAKVRKAKFVKKALKVDATWRPQSGVSEEMPGMFSGVAGILPAIAKFAQVPGTIDRFSDTIRGALGKSTLDDALNVLTSLNENVEKLTSDGVKHEHSVSHDFGFLSSLEYLWNHKKTIGLWTALLVLICLLLRSASKSVIMVFSIVCSVLIYKYYGGEIRLHWRNFLSTFSDTMLEVADDGYIPPHYFDKFEPQAVDATPFVKGGLFLIFATGLADFCPLSVTSFFDSTWSKLKSFPSHFSSLENTFSFYGKVIQDMLNSFCEMIGVDKKFAFSTDLYPKATGLVQEVEEFVRETRANDHLLVTHAAQMCSVFETKITTMLLEYKQEQRFQGTAVLLREARSRLRQLATDLELRGAGKTSTRVPPIAYMFNGQPKLGKSYFMTALTIAALGQLYAGNPAALKQIRAGQDRDFWYSANLNVPHWEGYCGQLIVQVDDVGTQRDVAGVDPEKSELHKLMRMINDAVYPLPFANLELKGKVEFDSAVILCTTNVQDWQQFQSIAKPSAFCRRFQGWDVRVTPKYSAEFFDGDERWRGVMPIHQLEEVLASEGKTEDEIEYFIRNSMFLEFRKRITIRSTQVGYADDKVYTTLEVIQSLCDDIRVRETAKVRKANHRQGLIDQWIPQSGSCGCMLCCRKFQPVFGETDLAFAHQLFGISGDKDKISPFVMKGWTAVKEDDEKYGLSQLPCLVDLWATAETEGMSFLTVLEYFGMWLKRGWFINQRSLLFDFRVGKVRKLLESIAVGLSAGLIALGLFKFGSWMFSGKERPKTEREIHAGLDDKWIDGEPSNLQPQARDLNAREMLTSTIYRNTYLASDHIAKKFGYMTFVHDNIVAIPNHFIDRWKAHSCEDEWMFLERIGDGCGGQKIYVDISVLLDRRNHFYPFGEDGDLVFVLINSRVLPRQATMRHKVFDDLCKWRSNGDMIYPIVNKVDMSVTYMQARYCEISASYKSELDRDVHVRSGIKYRAPSKKGDCGLPVSLQDSNSRKKIFGIHVAGTGLYGAAIPITTKMIDDSLEFYGRTLGYFPIEAQASTDPCVILDRNVGWDDLAEIPEADRVPGKVNLGLVEPPKNPRMTVIRPSPLFKKIEGAPPQTKPARLTPFKRADGTVVDVEAKAEAKYHQTVGKWDFTLIDLCQSQWTDSFLNHPDFAVDDRVGRGQISFENAVAGFEGVEGFDGLKRGTSAGYPYCTNTVEGGKRDIFGSEGDYLFDTPGAIQVRQYVDEDIALAEQGIRGKHVSRMTMKDERRPMEKVDEGKTRAILGAPLESSIENRMEMGAFTHAMYNNRIKCGSCIGMNVFDEADLLVEHLGEECRIIAGDFSGFDGKLPYGLMIRFCDSMDQFYGDWGSPRWKARRVLMEDICNSRHVDSKGRVIEWVGSNSSGNTLTSYINSWCNLIMLRYATLLILGIKDPREAYKFLANIDDHVKFAVYGDDNLIAVKPSSPYFNKLAQAAYTSAFAEMGLEYTDENKGSGEIDQNRHIGDVSFLKRSFEATHPIKGRKYMMALAVSTCLEMIQWKKKKDFYDEDVKRNAVNALQELSQHPRSIFERWRGPILNACSENLGGFVPIPNTYETCQVAVMSRGNVYW